MMSLQRRPAALAALIAATLALLLVALATTGSEAVAARKPKARRANLPNPAVLATPAPKAVPYIEGLKEHENHFFVYDLAAARVANTDERGSHLIVIPATPRDIADPWPTRGKHLCVFRSDPIWPKSGGGTCIPVAQFKREGVVTIGSMLDDSPDDVSVLVPNGVASVTVESPAGKRALRVKNNVVRFWRSTERYVSFDGPAGPVRHVIAPGVE